MSTAAAMPPKAAHAEAPLVESLPADALDRFGSAALMDAWLASVTFQAAIAAECLEFVSHRLQAQAKLVQAVSASPDIFWALTTQSGFVTTAVEDYQRETEVIARRLSGADAAREAA